MSRGGRAANASVRRVGVRELKTHLSGCLREVRQGRTVVVTDRGQPIGRIIPAAATLGERLEALRDAGHLAWSGRKLRTRRTLGKARGRHTVADLLIEDRG